MSDKPVNLNQIRKAHARIDAKAHADANAAKHGRSKAERLAEAARTDKARAFLDAHRFTEDE